MRRIVLLAALPFRNVRLCCHKRTLDLLHRCATKRHSRVIRIIWQKACMSSCELRGCGQPFDELGERLLLAGLSLAASKASTASTGDASSTVASE